MHFYKVAFVGRNLAPLTYHFSQPLASFSAVSAPLNNKPSLGYIIAECEKPEFKTIEILSAKPYFLTPIQIELAKFISHYYTAKIGVTLGLFEPSEQNFIKDLEPLNFEKIPNLNDDQSLALNFIQNNQTSLLFGDTGSGKSEIYISAIAKILKEGNQALFLMPEISLTPQMQRRLEYFFKDSVAIWHSKITPKKKAQILKGINDGTIRLIAGARSALFLPLFNLKLIVVDEEHDDSYKSTGSRPHYNARDLTLFLASKFDLRVILGSATPSPVSFSKQPTFRLKGTFFKSQKSFIFDESEPGLSPILKAELGACLAAKKQAIICLPTRANFRYLECKECANTIKCPFCSVGMSYYKRQNLLKCQYCEFKMPVVKSCDKCGSDMIMARKIGTSELLEQLQNEFAGAKIAKFDRDEITTQNKLVRALNEFNSGAIDVLVGTQMLSKGHDYHNVALAVIMGVDELLNLPDFRARERTLALAMQVAGRAGRSENGRVIIQSRQREFFEHFISDYDAFLSDELGFRDGLYPPFARLLRVVISHKNELNAKNITDDLIKKLKILQNKFSFEIVGYGKCAIERIGDKFRYEILLRASSHKPLLAAANICDINFVDIDIDPINFG